MTSGDRYDVQYRSTSYGRMLAAATLIIIVCIVALGLVLGFVLIDNKDTNTTAQCPTQATTTTTTVTVIPETTTPPYRTSDSVEGEYRFFAVASDAGPCSTIGTNIIMKKGGSAVDGAIATLLCQCVQNSHSCGIGGGFFMTVYNRENGTAYTINAREMAPGRANETMFAPDKSSTEGGLSIAVPGEVRGLYTVWQYGGKLPWRVLFEPTIKMLKEGWVVNAALAFAINRVSSAIARHAQLRETLTNPITRNLYVEGDIIKMPTLARTFEIIAVEGPDAFYNGSLTADIVQDIQDAGGIITADDLAKYSAKMEDPVTITLQDNARVFSTPPPGSGVVYEFILNVLDKYGFTADSVSNTQNSVLTWHRIVEAMKFAYAKRSSLGDPTVEDDAFKAAIDDLVKNMTSSDYAEYIRSKISDTATFGTMYYEPTFSDIGQQGTAHLSLLAPNGDAVSVTSTINFYFGSKIVGNRTGIIFNDEMDDFSTPNTVNDYGVPASATNFIKPYKRPISSMCPSVVVAPDGHVQLVVGAAGGTKITTSTALVTMETLWFNMGIKQAIDSSRVHHQLLPSYITIEKDFPQDIIDGLVALGHNITMADSAGSIVQGIYQPYEERISANCDYRKGAGYPDGC